MWRSFSHQLPGFGMCDVGCYAYSNLLILPELCKRRVGISSCPIYEVAEYVETLLRLQVVCFGAIQRLFLGQYKLAEQIYRDLFRLCLGLRMTTDDFRHLGFSYA